MIYEKGFQVFGYMLGSNLSTDISLEPPAGSLAQAAMKPWACCNEYAGDGEVVEFPVPRPKLSQGRPP